MMTAHQLDSDPSAARLALRRPSLVSKHCPVLLPGDLDGLDRRIDVLARGPAPSGRHLGGIDVVGGVRRISKTGCRLGLFMCDLEGQKRS